MGLKIKTPSSIHSLGDFTQTERNGFEAKISFKGEVQCGGHEEVEEVSKTLEGEVEKD